MLHSYKKDWPSQLYIGIYNFKRFVIKDPLLKSFFWNGVKAYNCVEKTDRGLVNNVIIKERVKYKGKLMFALWFPVWSGAGGE